MLKCYNGGLFSDLSLLAEAKRRRGVTLSVVIPALNEAQTIATEVSLLRPLTLGDSPLIDRLLVVDGGSSDGTAEIAHASGAEVITLTVPEGSPREAYGKGRGLNEAVLTLQEDYVVFLDADIINFSLLFFYGIAGPLIMYPDITMAKGFYKRPCLENGDWLTDEGGRVTEILVKPLLARYIPELCSFVQPLSGEYGFQVHALKKMVFYSGYGVDLALLIQSYKTYSLNALCQVDLGERRHRNRPLSDLSKMASSILGMFADLVPLSSGISQYCSLNNGVLNCYSTGQVSMDGGK